MHTDDDGEDEDDDQPLDMSGVWRRPLDEYIAGGQRLELAPMTRARFAHEDEDRDLGDRTEFITGVRGNEYHPEAYAEPSRCGEVWFELVPEPSNPFDPHALAVDLDGVRAGYVGARLAYRYQWLVRAENAEGKRCFAPGFIENPTSTWLVLPTLHALEEVIPKDKHLRVLEEIYESLPPELIAEIESDAFHLSPDSSKRVFQLRNRAPHMFPTSPNPDHFSPAWDKLLHSARLARNAARDALNQQTRAEQEEARELRRTAREAEKEQRRASVSALAHEGRSASSIGTELGISASSVVSVMRDLGLPVGTGGDNEYSAKQREDRVRRCLQALALQGAGANRRQIAAKLGVSEQSAKLLLADGRFYRQPDAYPERLELACRARDEGWSATTAKENGGQGVRALRDANALAQLSSECGPLNPDPPTHSVDQG